MNEIKVEFAEIEYDASINTVNKTDGHFFSASAQPIEQRVADPIREKFYDMRRLASDNPFARNDAGLFYKQAKFMEDFSDDYSGSAPFSMYYPYYQHMGHEQLRTYFTWRSKVRQSKNTDHLQPSLSYIFLYIYELLSCIGVHSPAEGLDKLMTIWRAYGKQESAIEKYLPGWIKDYHIYYNLPHCFADFVKEQDLLRYYPDLFLFEADTVNSLDLWDTISNYKITNSKFYNSDNNNALLLRACFFEVLNGISAFCDGRSIRIEDLFVYEVSRSLTWYPFRQALFYPWLRQPDCQIKMPGPETYYCQNNKWTADIALYHSGRGVLAGYIVKKMEACLRQAVKYKFKITADPKEVYNSFQKLKLLRITLAELDQVIERTVAAFYYDATRTIVTVDSDSLARIRKDALGTQDMLVVPEDTIVDLSTPPSAKPENHYTSPIPAFSAESGFAPDSWSHLRDDLNAVERTALKILSQNTLTDTIKAFADENNIMLEILIDGINEKALDHIGDNLLDEHMAFYQEYEERITELVG